MAADLKPAVAAATAPAEEAISLLPCISSNRKLPVLMIFIGMSFLLAFSSAKADVKGIPFNDLFATASFPYARVVQGCTEWRRPERFSDQWGPVSFAGACQEHDRCFHTPGAVWSDCNQRYVEDLQASCERDLGRDRLERSHSSKADPQALKLCFEIVDLYQAKAQGRDAVQRFEFAQKQAGAYLKYVRSVVSDVFKSVLQREATANEQEQALKTLAQDYTLDDLKAALMGQRLDDNRADSTAEIGGSGEPLQPIDTTGLALPTADQAE